MSAPTTTSKMTGYAAINDIREALRDDVIAGYPDFVLAVSRALDDLMQTGVELTRMRSDRPYTVGFNDGFALAAEAAAEIAERAVAAELTVRDQAVAEGNFEGALTRARQAQTAGEISGAIRALHLHHRATPPKGGAA